MKLFVGILVGFAIGAACRYFDIPAPSPAAIPGALLVLAMTLGYSAVDRLLREHGNYANNAHLCGGPTGVPAGQIQPIADARPADTHLGKREGIELAENECR
jgi:XapX domain-containing protein